MSFGDDPTAGRRWPDGVESRRVVGQVIGEDGTVDRVAVVGSGGAGKSTFAAALGERTGLPVVHLDRHYWQPGWVETPRDEWRRRQAELFAGDRWIADGNYGGTFDERFSRADTVIVLALPRLRCLAGALKRSALSHGKAMQAEGCPERFQLSFFRWIWNYDRDSRPRLDAALARHGHLDVVELTSRRAVRDFLESVEVSNVQRPGTSSGPGRRWNSNLHAFDQLLRAVPVGARCGLDVGCGEGETARRLRQRVPSVVGLDDDLASIELARSHGDDIDYLHGALETVELPAGAFDVVTAVAMLHHLDQRSGLARLAALVRPGGLLLVVGLARSRSIADFARDARDAVAIRRYTFTRDVWEKPAPKMWPPPLTYGETRAASLSVLPECQFRRVGHFRYGLTWVRPDDDAYRPT